MSGGKSKKKSSASQKRPKNVSVPVAPPEVPEAPEEAVSVEEKPSDSAAADTEVQPVVTTQPPTKPVAEPVAEPEPEPKSEPVAQPEPVPAPAAEATASVEPVEPVAATVEPEPEPQIADPKPPLDEPKPTPEPLPATGRERLRAAMHPRFTAKYLLVALLCGVLGFFLVVQVRQHADAGLDSLRESDLVTLLEAGRERDERIAEETRELERRRDQLAADVDGNAAQREVRAQEELVAILAGTVPVRGPGIELVIPGQDVEADSLLDAVQELRAAGAEGISINGVRVVASTSFVDTDGGVSIDGTIVGEPYRFLVVGDPRTLTTALEIPGGVLQVLRQANSDATVEPRDEVVIDDVRTIREPRYAELVPQESEGP